MKWEKAIRHARAAISTALDVLAEREGLIPSNDAGSAVTAARRQLIEADRYLATITLRPVKDRS